MFFKSKEKNTQKYDIILVKKLQAEGKIPKFRIVSETSAFADDVCSIEVMPHTDIECAMSLRHICLDENLWRQCYPTLKKGEWVEMRTYLTYLRPYSNTISRGIPKELAKKVIDEQIILLLKDIKVSTSYEEYP